MVKTDSVTAANRIAIHKRITTQHKLLNKYVSRLSTLQTVSFTYQNNCKIKDVGGITFFVKTEYSTNPAVPFFNELFVIGWVATGGGVGYLMEQL